MRPASRVAHECDEYEIGKPDDLTPSRQAELVVSTIREMGMRKPPLLPLTPEEEKLIEKESCWTEEYDPKVKYRARRLYRNGMTMRAIAAKLDISDRTIFGWCKGLR